MIAFCHFLTSNIPVDLADTNSMFLVHKYCHDKWLLFMSFTTFFTGLTLGISAQFGFAFT